MSGDERGDDPYLWLEEVTGERALAWVREHNNETIADLASGERFTAIRDGIRAALDSTRKLPAVTFRGNYLYNFWQDAQHRRGIWRRATVEGLRADEWEVLLDVDALAEAEGENWVFKGASGLRPDYNRYLVRLSRGGADATVVREFDLAAPGGPAFVDGGFFLPEAKSSYSWIDIDTIFVGTDFDAAREPDTEPSGPGSMTASGYPRIVKRWRRGTPLEAAETVFEGRHEDVSVHAFHDQTPGFERDVIVRSTDFHNSQWYLLKPDDHLVALDTPTDARIDIDREWLLVRPRTPWELGTTTFAPGTLLAFRLDDYLDGSREPAVLFEPSADTILQYWAWTQHYLVLGLLRDVHSELLLLDPDDGWARSPLPGVPTDGHTTVQATNADLSDEIVLVTTGFLEPSTMRYGIVTRTGGTSEEGSSLQVLRQEPAFFASDGLRVEQHWATSDDGTRVPYFHVIGRDPDGPTLLEAYGGFEVSRTPAYDPAVGLGWLAYGGSYVLANIRGGGEFGPQWHRAALRENRPRAFEDLAAVARDLIARGVTKPSRLGVTGGSNGGLLMGVMLTRYPSLFGAIAGWVPLLDMRRFHLLLAGASWVAEYGDPDSDDWSFIGPYSPYQNIGDGEYPPVLWLTSTRDDRVHPGHARKMTARLRERGHRAWLYENIEGGHASGADNEQRAFAEALAFEFLWRHLTGVR